MVADILVFICLGIGLFVSGLGVVGILRFPDVYTRLHAETKMTTLGAIFICLAVIITEAGAYLATGDMQYAVFVLHTVLALAALAFTNALGAHAIGRAAYRSGIRPDPSVVDRMKEVKTDD
ncbi:monovalent cation/H(+) antiporter subunit G [Methanogenium sp. S4BF]|uniref:monovalent cation/H(+) antiporter subunit G n=1 Tax=Methanogenium sp. S4BF TaxID=1789226 RepID=UPI0024176A40|nr:monovalent cation/H(+) antiporter subunit G [Methanogenium sp. S4BF]WFN34920.1 monovalent cation/H(+) antiporter subunit G [Methanogenium sp. S4BF]